MKKTLMVLALATSATTAFSQGQLQMINFASGASAFQAPIFDVEAPGSANAGIQLRGNPATGAIPAGTQVYTGARLAGTGFTSELWGGPLGSAESALTSGGATSSFRTGTGAGFNNGGTAVIQGVAAGSQATVQLRAWNNMGGTVTSWAMAIANPLIPHGSSDLVTSSALTAAPATPVPANLLRSFNLFVVPEPSLIALGALGLGALLLRRIRK